MPKIKEDLLKVQPHYLKFYNDYILLLCTTDKLEDLQLTVTNKMPVIIYLYAYVPFPVILTELTHYLNRLNLLNTFV